MKLLSDVLYQFIELVSVAYGKQIIVYKIILKFGLQLWGTVSKTDDFCIISADEGINQGSVKLHKSL